LASPDTVEAFIVRWQSAGGSERANYQLFITELCELLGLPKPEPAKAEAEDNAYVFERRVTFRHGDGSSSNGYIDCYRRATSSSKPSRPGSPKIRARSSTTPCCAPAARPRTTPAPCRPARAGRPS